MKKKVLIIDDENDARLLIRQYISSYNGYDVIAECDNGIDAVTSINQLEPDLIFLDIKMPGLSGFQVVQQLIHIPQIIFTTAYDQYALKAFESNAIDYLLKPYTAERFNKAMTKLSLLNGFHTSKVQTLAHEYSGTPFFTRILVESGNRFINLATNEVLYIEADKDYCKIHTESKAYLSNYGIGLLEQRMDPSQFLRIHRSYIVNIEHIKELHKDGSTAQVIMKNNHSLNVSRTYMEELKKLLY
jgi:two-component system, LytTR family, response regulator